MIELIEVSFKRKKENEEEECEGKESLRRKSKSYLRALTEIVALCDEISLPVTPVRQLLLLHLRDPPLIPPHLGCIIQTNIS